MMNQWDFEQEKRFHAALLCYPEDYLNRWENIAQVVGVSKEMVFQRYQNLQIELDRVQPPQYMDYSSNNQPPARNRRPSWSLEEHTLFLVGVQKYGKSHWNNISVVTRDVTQVASHAQKFYIRQEERETREHKRRSINDITLENSNPEYLDYLLSLRPHLVPDSNPTLQQYHQAALTVDYDHQLNLFSPQMNQDGPYGSSCVQLQELHYQPHSQVRHQTLQWNQGYQSESQFPYVSPTLQWNQGDQSESQFFYLSQVRHQTIQWNEGDQSKSQFPYLSPTHQSTQQNYWS